MIKKDEFHIPVNFSDGLLWAVEIALRLFKMRVHPSIAQMIPTQYPPRPPFTVRRARTESQRTFTGSSSIKTLY